MSLTAKANKEIQLAIKNSMPEMVGDALKERLKQADKFEKENKSLNKEITSLNEELKKKENSFNELEKEFIALKNKADEVEQMRKNLDYNQRQFEITQAVNAVKVESAQEKVDLMKEVMKVPFQNRILRESALVHKPEKTQCQSGYDINNNPIITENNYNVPYEDRKETEEG